MQHPAPCREEVTALKPGFLAQGPHRPGSAEFICLAQLS